MKTPYDIIKIDKYTGKMQTPTLLLRNRSFDIIGKISKYENWNISLVANGLDEISFEVPKYTDGIFCPVWNDLVDLKIVDVEGFGRFEISVDYTDNTETVKSIHGQSLEVELGQIGLYEFHVNDDEAATMEAKDNEDDFDENGHFIPTVFYHRILATDTPEQAEKKRKHSLLNRVLADKAPHWKIGHVPDFIILEDQKPEPVETFQRTYTCDGDTIYDFLTGTVAEESNVIFIFDTVSREINCYNLCEYIDEDGNVIGDCISKDTNILVSKRKLANEITISSNKDNVKNCFRIEGGDDVITDFVRAVNMNGSNYIYQFADFQYNDMPEELRENLKKYHTDLAGQENIYYGNGDMDDFLNGTLQLYVTSEPEAALALSVCKNNKIKTNNTDISAYTTARYWHIVTSNDGKELRLSNTANTEISTIKNVTNAFQTMGIFPRLCAKYEELAYFESSMMPEVVISETTAEEQYEIMKNELTSMMVGVSSVNNYNNDLFVGVSNNVEAMANILIDARYKAEVIEDSASFHKKEKKNPAEKDAYIWTGNIKITRAADENDYYPKTNEQINDVFSVNIDDDALLFAKQKIQKALSKGSMLDIDFDIGEIWDDTELKSEEKTKKIREYFNQYSLNRLKSFYDGYNSCISILTTLGQTTISDVQNTLYEKYQTYLKIISNPPTTENPTPVPGVMDIRQAQVDAINAEIKNIEQEQSVFTKEWNLENYLNDYGEDLYKKFCAYRREDTYSNSNYISDGLTTSGCLQKAKELVEAATKEAKKACVLQRTVSTSLNNLFALPEFEPLYEKFALFNYIRIRTEDEILKLRLIGIDFNGESIEDINVTFSEQIESMDGKMSDLQSIIQQAGNIATSYSSTVLQAKQGADAKNTFSEMYNTGLNAANMMLKNNDNNEITITQSGIICRRMDDEGYYGEKQLRITGNMMAFTTDNWKTVEMAIGETTFKDPVTGDKQPSYGVIAESIVGKIILGQNLGIYNHNGNDDVSMSFDQHGLKITNNQNTFIVDPNANPEDGLLQILKDDKKQFYISEDGNVCLSGSINIGNDNFIVDTNGNITSEGTMCLASGNLTYSKEDGLNVVGKINGCDINSSTFNSGSINIGNGNFVVDENGNAKINGSITATTLSAQKEIKIYYGEYEHTLVSTDINFLGIDTRIGEENDTNIFMSGAGHGTSSIQLNAERVYVPHKLDTSLFCSDTIYNKGTLFCGKEPPSHGIELSDAVLNVNGKSCFEGQCNFIDTCNFNSNTVFTHDVTFIGNVHGTISDEIKKLELRISLLENKDGLSE